MPNPNTPSIQTPLHGIQPSHTPRHMHVLQRWIPNPFHRYACKPIDETIDGMDGWKDEAAMTTGKLSPFRANCSGRRARNFL